MSNGRMTQLARVGARRRGFTMAEMVVAVTIMVIVTAVVASLFVQVRKMIGLTQWGAETRAELRNTVNTLAQDLRNVNSKAYFVMLNRDYGWDATLNPAWDGKSNPATRVGPVLYKDDPVGTPRCLWADRIAFVADGPFNTLQGQQVDNSGIASPAVGASARVYYGHSLWTHELTDMVWTTAPTAMTPTLNPFIPQGMPAANGPSQMSSWTNNILQRPAVDWTLCRQAILHVSNTQADGPDGPLAWTSGQQLFVGAPREIDWRAAVDSEYAFLNTSQGLYTLDDLTRAVNGWMTGTYGVPKDWTALVLPPRIDAPPTTKLNDPTVMARSRLLLQHAARVRFQVRLSDGTIVPQTDDNQQEVRLRGGLLGVGTTGSVVGWNPDFTLPSPIPPVGTNWGFFLVDPKLAPSSVHADTNTTPQVPLRQMAYIWTGTRSNLAQAAANPVLYPVALRIRIEVYDPEKRTPDPIRVDEWLPIRWQR